MTLTSLIIAFISFFRRKFLFFLLFQRCSWLYFLWFCEVDINYVCFNFAGVSVAVQVESLHSLLFLCSQLDESLCFQLLGEFPSLLVPLSSDNKV